MFFCFKLKKKPPKDKSLVKPAEKNVIVEDRVEIQRICMESMKVCGIGETKAELQNGLDFYKFFFENYPDLRVYFKGAQNFTPEDVQKSERFEKQGQRLLLAIHICVTIFYNKSVFHAYIRETINRHRQYRMEPALWSAFWAVWLGYLEKKTKNPLDETTKEAWTDFGAEFAHIAGLHLKKLELPH